MSDRMKNKTNNCVLYYISYYIFCQYFTIYFTIYFTMYIALLYWSTFKYEQKNREQKRFKCKFQIRFITKLKASTMLITNKNQEIENKVENILSLSGFFSWKCHILNKIAFYFFI